MTELTFAILKYGFLALLWVFVFLAIRALHSDITVLSGHKNSSNHSRKHWKIGRKSRQMSNGVQYDESASNGLLYAQQQEQLPPAYPDYGAVGNANNNIENNVANANNGGVSESIASTNNMPVQSASQQSQYMQPMLLVVIDGPLAGTSTSLTEQPVTLGRAGRNTVVLDDEFVSSYHARVYQDPTTAQWVIEDLGSTNGTLVNGQRINSPTFLPPRMPVRIGATTFELR